MSRRVYRRMRSVGLMAIAVLSFAFLLPATSPTAQGQVSPASAYTRQLELLGPHQQVIGALYQPTTASPNESTALFVMHETANFLSVLPCTEMAQRGFTVLCAKTQFTQEGQVDWNQIALDVGYSVSFLRSLPTVKHVVLVGWSGGGPIMAYYQNVAENGIASCQAPQRLDPCSSALAGLPPADGVVLLDAIPGLAFAFLAALDPSTAKPDGLTGQYNPSLYLFNPKNGYNTNTSQSSSYSPAFINRYTAAQATREADLVSQAQQTQEQIAAGHGPFSDTAPLPVGRDKAVIWETDTSLLAHTQGKYALITPSTPDGSAPQVVDSLRTPAGSLNFTSAQANASWNSSGYSFTDSTFLSTFSIKAPAYQLTPDSITGVDWASSNTATVTNVGGITTPLLIMAMTGHYWVVPSEMYYQAANRTSDKTLAFVWGASHGFTPCTECTLPAGDFGNTVAETFDYVANWVHQRF